jgi:hypothetical protein
MISLNPILSVLISLFKLYFSSKTLQKLNMFCENYRIFNSFFKCTLYQLYKDFNLKLTQLYADVIHMFR